MGLILPGAPQFSLYESTLPATPITNSPGTSITHYASGPHVKNPTYTELIASTAFDATLIIVTPTSNVVANGDSSTLLDIAIGAASSESVIIPDLAVGFAPTAQAGPRHYIFPLYIPAGSRLSATSQSIRTTGSVTILVQLFGGPRDPARWWYGSHVEAVGENAANSSGTKFTPGNTGAEGTGVSLGTLSQHAECLVLGIQGHPDDVSWGTIAYHIDVGIDSSSTEWISTDAFYAQGTSGEVIGTSSVWLPIFRPLPAGTEIMVRGEASGTADALSAVVYAVS